MHNLPPPYTDVLYYYIAVWLCVPRTLYTCFIDCVCASSIILFPTSFFLFLRSWMCLHFFVCSPASGITNYTPCTAKLCRDWNFLSIIRSILDWLKNRFFFCFSSRDYTLPAIRRFDEKKTQSWAATRLGISKNGKNPQGRMFNRNIGSLPTHRVYCTSRAAVEGVGMTAHPKESHFE